MYSDSYFYKEIREFLDCVLQRRCSSITSPESVVNSIKIALAEVESAKKKGTFYYE